MFTKKTAIVSVINDLVTDSRVLRTCSTLEECGYNVILLGRRLPSSLPLPRWTFKAVRMRLLFKKGPLFYVFFNLRLFFKLLFTHADLLYANDLDTLGPNYLVSKLKDTPLIYDSHELFCEVPELANSPFKRGLWQWLEARTVPRLTHRITVNNSIAKVFKEKYRVNFSVIRNISPEPNNANTKSKAELGLPPDKKIIVLQGAGINVDRGAEELVDAMKLVDKALLLIIGGGDVWPVLEEKIKQNGLSEKVRMIRKIPKSELVSYTRNADIGLSIDKNTNLNYYYSLPNKIFDYVQSGVPILASRLPEIEQIVSNYGVGEFIENHSPEHIAARLNDMLFGTRLEEYCKNTLKAKEALNWENEKMELIKVIQAASKA